MLGTLAQGTGLAKGAGESRHARDAFPYAYAYNDCAPWDGHALTVVLQPVPFKTPPADKLPDPAYPQLDVHIWQSAPQLHLWISIPGWEHNTSNGGISLCKANLDCQAAHGRLLLTRLTQTRVEGEVHYQLDKGTDAEHVVQFSAPILPYMAMCGGVPVRLRPSPAPHESADS